MKIRNKLTISAGLLLGNVSFLESSETGDKVAGGYLFPLLTILILVLLFLLYLVGRYKKELKSKNELITQKEEKIKWLRQISAENEHKRVTKEHEVEKKIMELNHTIQTLEEKAKEGMKNQLVAKIEAQQSKRARQLERAGLNV